MRCKHCNGGTIPAGYNYPAHTCTDCEGTGETFICECCEQECAGSPDYDNGYCDDCNEEEGDE